MATGRIGAIILAAGESTRMERLKQLLPWAGITLIEWQAAQMRLAGADDVVVVLGHAAEEIRAAIDPATARIVVNDNYREGRATSMCTGAVALDDTIAAVLVLGVDQPRPGWLARRLIDGWREGGGRIIQPRLDGRRDHPVLLDGSLLPELRTVTEETLGLRAVVERHASESRVVTIERAGLAVDLNTPADYAAALAAFERGDWAE